MVVRDGKKQREVAKDEGISHKNVSHWVKNLEALKEEIVQNPKGLRAVRESKYEYLFVEVAEETTGQMKLTPDDTKASLETFITMLKTEFGTNPPTFIQLQTTF